VYATLLANSEPLYQDVMAAAELAGERFWRLPVADEYRWMYESQVAEIRASGGRDGVLITSGLFIAEFVAKAAWVHLDIAGMTGYPYDRPYMPRGYNGFATRTLAELALLGEEAAGVIN